MKDLKKQDSGLYVLMVTTVMILFESIKSYTFPILGTRLSFSLFLLPLSYYIIHNIVKKFDYKKGVAAISISAVIFVCFTSLLSFIVQNEVLIGTLAGDFCGYVVSQFINIAIFLYVRDYKKDNIGMLIVIYFVSLMVFGLFSSMNYLDTMTFHYFCITYFCTLLFQGILSIFLSILEKKER